MSTFVDLYFQNFMVYTPHFVFFRLLDWHLMRLISWKNLVFNTLFFLLQPLEYVYPLTTHWTKTWEIINDKYLCRKRLNIIYKLFWTIAYLSFEKIKKWKYLEFYISYVYQYYATIYEFVYLRCVFTLFIFARYWSNVFLNMK